MTLRVRCEYTLEIEVPDGLNAEFVIEDNGCPGTGIVGEALRALIGKHEAANTCWACAAGGKNTIVGVK